MLANPNHRPNECLGSQWDIDSLLFAIPSDITLQVNDLVNYEDDTLTQ